MRLSKRLLSLVTLGLLAALVGCDRQEGPSGSASTGNIPDNAIVIDIIYAPESDLYLPQTIEEFNRAFASGTNPVTGQRLAEGERPIWVTGRTGSSGTVMQGIVNAIIAPNSANVEQPVIFAPSVSHWLALANYQSGRQIFDLAEARPTALAPVVMAIWESRMNAIRNTVAAREGVDPASVEIGWEELLEVLQSPNGWQDYGIEGGRRTVYYGHTDPFISSTALSTLIAEFYASARQNGFTGRRLTLDQVNDPAVQEGVRSIEQLIRHYSQRTTEFRQYIAQGPDYLDFVALEENDLIFINLGRTDISPPEPLVALYPKEGTFWHEHPFAIVNGPWVDEHERAAARTFTDYVLTPAVQTRIMEQGFRPANPDVPLGYPFVRELGVTPEGPTTVLDVPAPEVVAAIQNSWSFVKKQADIWIVMDISGSMEQDNKLQQAIQAAEAFLDGMESSNRVGLVLFNNTIDVRVPLANFETNQSQLRSHIRGLRAGGGTELYAALITTLTMVNETEDEDRIRAIVLLSDGEDTGERGTTLNDVVNAINASRDSLNPVIVIPVAYGEGAATDEATRALNTIARASNTRVTSGDPQNIQSVLQIISSYF